MHIASVKVPRIAVALLVSDLVTVLIASGIAHDLIAQTFGRAGWGLARFLPHLLGQPGSELVYAFCVMAATFAMGLHQRRYMHGKILLRSLAGAALLSLGGWAALDLLIWQGRSISAPALGQHLALFAVIGALRPITCFFFSHFLPRRKVAVVGSQTTCEAMRLAEQRAMPAEFEIIALRPLNDTQPAGDLGDIIRDIMSSREPDEIATDALALEPAALHALRPTACRFTSAASLVEDYAHWSSVDEPADAGQPGIAPPAGHFGFLKRVIDTVLAAAGLIFVLPVFLAVALVIKLQDGGPVFYRQVRVGKGGKPFSILKFRSMIVDAEADGKPRWATEGDSRITPFGQFIRRTRLDELPQLLNILRGDMALVGPRPERPEIVARLEQTIPNYKLRHLVRPGLTGWAQINHDYGGSLEGAQWKTRFDLFYIRKWTLLLDLAIMAQTVRVVLLGEGAR